MSSYHPNKYFTFVNFCKVGKAYSSLAPLVPVFILCCTSESASHRAQQQAVVVLIGHRGVQLVYVAGSQG